MFIAGSFQDMNTYIMYEGKLFWVLSVHQIRHNETKWLHEILLCSGLYNIGQTNHDTIGNIWDTKFRNKTQLVSMVCARLKQTYLLTEIVHYENMLLVDGQKGLSTSHLRSQILCL